MGVPAASEVISGYRTAGGEAGAGGPISAEILEHWKTVNERSGLQSGIAATGQKKYRETKNYSGEMDELNTGSRLGVENGRTELHCWQQREWWGRL